MKREEHVDYHLVNDDHLAIHARLTEWARWVRVRPTGWQMQPMFRQYQTPYTQDRREPRIPVNIPEAMDMERSVSLLPAKNRDALRWCYVFAGSPVAAAKHLDVTKRGLLELVKAGREMLKGGV